jgi:hypothetical protein
MRGGSTKLSIELSEVFESEAFTELFRGALVGESPPFGEHDDLVEQRETLEDVGRDEHRAAARRDPAEVLYERPLELRVEARARLVEAKQAGA